MAKKISKVRGTKKPRRAKVPRTRNLESAPNDVPMSQQIDVVEQARRNMETTVVTPVVPVTGTRSGAKSLSTTADGISASPLFMGEVDFARSADENIKRIMDEKFSTKTPQGKAPTTKRKKVRRKRGN